MLFVSALAALLVGNPFKVSAQSAKIQWQPCGDALDVESNYTYFCGTHEVPRDWMKPERPHRKIDLHLVRIPAVQQPSNSSIFFNFGGPGGEARKSLIQAADQLFEHTGGIYDLIAIEPRGTSTTLPIDCGKGYNEAKALVQRSDLPHNVSPQNELGIWKVAQDYAHECHQHAAQTGDLIGTAYTARDLMSVVDVLERDSLLRFWGFSYGSVLGATAAAMFPDRIDRLVIDGVPNIREYYDSVVQPEELVHDEEIFTRIWSACIDAGPSNCPLAGQYGDFAGLQSAIANLQSTMAAISVSNGNVSFVLDRFTLSRIYVQAEYDTAAWPPAARITSMLLQNDHSLELFTLLTENFPYQTHQRRTERNALYGIACSDSSVRIDSMVDWQSAVNRVGPQLQNVSIAEGSMICAQWKFKAEGRYSGP